MITQEVEVLRARVTILERVVQDLYLKLDRLERSGEVPSAPKPAPIRSPTSRQPETLTPPDRAHHDVDSFIRDAIEQRGYPPTYDEIARRMTYDSPQGTENSHRKPVLEVVKAA